GGDYELAGGQAKTILIRFGDLERAIGHKRVTSARLILHVSDGSANLRSIARVKVPWGEGPVRRPSFMQPRPGEPAEPVGAATWRSRLTGFADWQLQGATGPDDAEPIAGAKLTKLDGDFVAIEGITPQVSEMATRWYDNFGFALQFEGSVMFESSQAPFNRPRLELTLEDAAPVSGADLAVLPLSAKDSGDAWEVSAKVKNLGDAPSGPFHFLWLNESRPGVMSENPELAPGGELNLTYKVAKHGRDPRFATIALRLYPKQPDADPSDDQAEYFLGGGTVNVPSTDWKLGARTARFVNETVFGQSRFSFARDGVTKRVNPVLSEAPAGFEPLVEAILLQAGAQDLRAKTPTEAPYAEGMLGGETRCDSILFPQISLPSEPYFTPLLDNSGLEATDLLGMTNVALLNGITPAAPKVVFVRPVNRMGAVFQNVQIAISKEGQQAPLATLPPSTSEAVPVPGGIFDGDLLHTVYRVDGTLNGVTASSFLYGWQLLDCASRGNANAAIIDIPLDLPNLELGETNLAEGKDVSDSANRPAEMLAVLTKEGNTTPVTVSGKRGSWVEIDLARDRSVGEVLLLSKNLPPALDIMTYETGQKPEDATLWARDPDARWRLAHRPIEGGLAFRPSAGQFRFIRIVSRFDQPDWELTGIRVRSAKVGP
ncbi:MAG: hypothetical protein JSS65_07880, partial [Armatimonadetes bacterium]|nr:hypothetical protein [Armatimonadota bacterium]